MLRDFLTGCCLLLVATAFGQPHATSSAPPSVRIYNASRINTAEMEFCPAIYEQGLVYVSRYKNGPVNPATGETFYELFYSELDPNGLPGRPQSFSQTLNSAYHEGPVSFSRDGKRIFFTRTNLQNGVRRSDARGQVGFKIYEAEKGLYDWENVRELPFNSNDYSCLHPALSADGKRLFFASNRGGADTYGGFDLYMVEFDGQQWGQPINLGPEINTPRNEAFPFYHESGTLFFSSDGHPGQGGYDLFMIDISSRRWGQLRNLGAPFCSPSDDLGLVLIPDATRGYFTSGRAGGYGQDDIYFFESPQGLQGLQAAPQLHATVTVYDAATSRRLMGASVRLYALTPDGMVEDENLYDLELVSSQQPGAEVNLRLVRKREEELAPPLATTDRNGETVVALTPGKEMLLLISKAGFFDQELKFKVMDEGPDRPLEILLRPSNCINLAGTVNTQAYGIPVPGAKISIRNLCNGDVIEVQTDVNSQFEACLESGCDFDLTVSKPGYEPSTTQVTTARLRGSRSLNVNLEMRAIDQAIIHAPIAAGTVIVLQNIYYDFNKSTVRTGSASDLEALVKLMNRYPSMIVEMGAHTDSRGDHNSNLELSLRRAEAAKDFLVQRGIDAERIRAVGYGEAFPRNQCVDGVSCTEAEHGLNRRTEVKVLSINERAEVGYHRNGSLDVKD